MSNQPEMFVYVFGDQAHDVADDLSSLLQSRTDPLVVNFLESSCVVLKTETAHLSPEQRARCPRFGSMADLLSPYRNRTLNPCLVQALTCVTQLGLFIRQHSSGNHVYPVQDNSCLAGVCTGALAAAAVSCSHSAPSLLSAGLHAVAVAVRVGALAWDVAERVSNLDGDSAEAASFESWSRAVTGCCLTALADTLLWHASDNGLPAIKAPYISAVVGPTQATVSGPPDVLSDFFTSGAGKLIAPASASLRITAPYHSAVLYSESDIENVLQGIPERDVQQTSSPMISTSAEVQALSAPMNLRDALGQAVRDCLMRPMALGELPSRIAEHARSVLKTDDGEAARVSVQSVAFHNRDSLVSQLRLLLPSETYRVRGRSEELLPSSIPNGISDEGVGSNKPPLAILSASGRFPGNADTMDQFWDILYNGIDTHEMVPPSRWDASTHVGDTSIKNVSGTGYGCWLHQAGQFDTTFFNISPREASRIDPAQRLALMTAAEALEKAGIVPDRTPSTMRHRVGVWYGACSMDWLETNSAQDIDAYFIPGGARAFIAGRVNYFFKFTGPSYTVDTACSSSLAALHQACNALWRGEVDTAIVGGTNITTNPDITTGLDRGHFLSRTGNCKTFDDEADGYCRGEAVVTLILKRLGDAKRDRDPIEACLLGAATNHNAEADSITRPNTAAQRDLFEHLLADTLVSPNDISYVEMHGTGTQAGDAGETSSIVATLAPLTARGSSLRPASSPLYLGAAKANIGHGESASGVTSIAKVLMMMRHSVIPPHIGVKTKFNHRLPNLEARNTRIAMEPVSWPRPRDGSRKRRVLLNNFSAAGGNTSIVMEDAPMAPETCRSGADPRRHHVVTVSSKTPESLVANVSNLLQWLESEAPRDDANLLAKLSYTTTARRAHHRFRVAVGAASLQKLRSNLQRQLETLTGSDKILPVPSKAPGVVFTFTGQGSQYAGMGSELYARFASFRADVRRYDHLCVQMGFPSVARLFESKACFDEASLTCLQLAHVAFQMALCRLWESFGIAPTAVVGHSLGEYPALYAAGVLSQSDVLYIVGRRSQLMEEHLPGGTHAMLVCKADEPTVLGYLDVGVGRDLEVACRNGKTNTVLGGEVARIQEARSVLESKHGIRCRLLETAHAFHTAQVEPILAPFRKATKAVVARRPRIPVISAVLGRVLRESADFGDDYFVKHCRQPVNFLQAVAAASSEGLLGSRAVAIEIGPSPVVAPMVKEAAGSAMQTCASASKTTDPWQLFAEALTRLYLAGASPDWNRYHADFPECQQVLQIPTYAWNLREYWMQYTNDWTLRKGDAAFVRGGPAPLAFSPIYKVVKNTLQASSGGEAVVDVDLEGDDDVHSMAQGHKVYGVSLVTPSMYADIVQMIGAYVQQNAGMDSDAIVSEVAEMHIQSALVANNVGTKQVLRTTARFNDAKTMLSCSFSSVDSNGKIVEQHANCQIRFVETDSVRAQFAQAAETARERMRAIQAQVGVDDNIFRLSRSMLYRMVGRIADFDVKYRGLTSFTINNDTLEAVGTACFRDVPSSGRWFANPGFLDAVSQLAGFAMNANEFVDLDKEVYVNHGWSSMNLLGAGLDADATYRLYVKMVQGDNDLWLGDVLVFAQDGGLAGVLRGCALQRVSKRVMEFIINSAMKKASKGGAATLHERSQSQPRNAFPAGGSRVRRSVTADELPPSSPVRTNTAADKAPDTWPAVLKVLAEESGLEETELADEVALVDIGIDSLLSLVVTGRLREELEVNLPERAIFEECLTIGDIRMRVCGGGGAEYPRSESVRSAERDLATTAASDTVSSAGSVDMDSSATLSSDSTTPVNCHSKTSYFSAACSDYEDEEPLSAAKDLKPVVKLRDVKHLHHQPPPTAVIANSVPPAWSMYMQGSRLRSTENLFFFPDGCGTATSYLCLPGISPTTALIAFNSPFAKNPERMYEYSLRDVLASYLAGLRSRQPHGPYRLGGWSAGGILAYAVAQELIAAGETVTSLTLIDSPAPVRGLDILPESFYDHCIRTGIFRSEMRRDAEQFDPPDWLIPHFRAATALLHDYHAPATAPDAARRMRVTIIWAAETAFDGVRYPLLPEAIMADECEGMKFLTESRRDFGPGDWTKLLPGADITTRTVEGEHHFSIMRGRGAEKVVEYIRNGL
ncbi:Non-reducing polyketide synthase pks27 [Colletotrichum sidae]|uniref:Non-reducing polyketide synthase pks27 n=1 Tax=Colletotrichum sidae TaxID=1347389 RepID=A0A4R8TB46_9PEZI|nr:Non-reducing polyketide synthase pks27 [Colletotrichum sidae]